MIDTGVLDNFTTFDAGEILGKYTVPYGRGDSGYFRQKYWKRDCRESENI